MRIIAIIIMLFVASLTVKENLFQKFWRLIMSKVIFMLMIIFVLIAVTSGCSNRSTIPTSPGFTVNDPVSLADYETDIIVIAEGSMNVGTGEIKNSLREINPYLNVTGILGSNFSFTIDDFIPPDTLQITLSINNPSTLTVHDVCIVFDDLYGKTVLNPDSYMDIFKPWDIDPFIAFRKESPERDFPPGVDKEQLLLKFPGGSSPYINYFIIAHLGGNTGGVYEIRDWDVSGQLTPSGGSATIKIGILDYQGDVTGVWADTTALTSGISQFTQTADPETWELAISNTANAPAGDYQIPVMSISPASPVYQTYNFFKIKVSEGGVGEIRSIQFRPKEAGDEYYDICVMPGGYVYVCADHFNTGNVGPYRTTLRFENDLSHIIVINESTGMNDPESLGLIQYWNRIDVSDGGFLVTNPGFKTIVSWYTEYDSATIAYDSNSLSCGGGWVGCRGIADVWDHSNDAYGTLGCGWIQTADCPTTQWAVVLKRLDYGDHGQFGGMSISALYDFDSIAGINGIDDTENSVFFISDSANGKIALCAPTLLGESIDFAQIDSTGTLGTGDGQFTGGLDITVDSSGNIVTCENHGSGVYRFQKFTASLDWLYTSRWKDDGDPLRMDFDKVDNTIFLISSTGIHIMSVD
jgi:hypothetical protein